MSSQSNATVGSTSAQAETGGGVYMFRSMKELDALIEKSDMRVQNAQNRLQSDFSNAELVVKQALTLKRLAREIGFGRFAKALFNAFFKRR